MNKKADSSRAQFSEMATLPDKLWFRAKRYGWGWYPATWQGWGILAMYVFAIVSEVTLVAQAHYSARDWLVNFIPMIYFITVFFIIICYATGEKPEWRWGNKKEECFDILDDKGNPTGTVATRTETHRKGLWHRAAHVYVFNDQGDILLQRRLGQKSLRPGRWYISAGAHLRAGETPRETAVRELKEELSLSVPETALEFAGTATKKHVLLYGTYVNNEFDDIFVVRNNLDIDKAKKTGEAFFNGEVCWFPFDKFREYIQGGDPNFVDYEGLPVLFKYIESVKKA